MTGHSFAIFDTAIGRCGIVWGARGITGVQLPMGSEEKTRTRIRQSHGDIAENLNLFTRQPPLNEPGRRAFCLFAMGKKA